jgi:hypothetical protein
MNTCLVKKTIGMVLMVVGVIVGCEFHAILGIGILFVSQAGFMTRLKKKGDKLCKRQNC